MPTAVDRRTHYQRMRAGDFYLANDPEIAGFDGDLPERRNAQNPASAFGSQPTLGRRSYQRGLLTFVWRADDENRDDLIYDIFYRREGETAWKALNDPEALKAAIPGCESIEATGENEFAVVMTSAIGPVKAMLLEMNVAELSAMIRDELKNAGGGETLRPKLAHFAETHGIPV